MKKNNAGAEKIISVYWFAILFLVAAGVAAMVVIFYGKPYDVRELEADILTNSIANCLSEVGYLKPNVLGNSNFRSNFLGECKLNFDVESTFTQPQYYLKVQIFQDANNVFEVSEGNLNLISSCGVESTIEKENLAKCSEKTFYSLGTGNVLYSIKVLSIVRKTEKNVRV
jgi:hypothetical protein